MNEVDGGRKPSEDEVLEVHTAVKALCLVVKMHLRMERHQRVILRLWMLNGRKLHVTLEGAVDVSVQVLLVINENLHKVVRATDNLSYYGNYRVRMKLLEQFSFHI
jgi:hypothetical protein